MLLWLIPLVSITDVVWAIFTKMGVTVTFGLGLYKLDSIHIAIQVALMVAISLLFIAAGPSSAQEARGGRGGEADKRARRGGR
ncbi:MAG: hypothetical protein ACUVV6_00605 [Thermoplasmatota archaeon]